MGWRTTIFAVFGFVVAGCTSSGAACCEGDLLGSYVVAECGERFCIGGNADQCVGEGSAIADGICGETDAGPGFDGGPPDAGATEICADTCAWASDGECDDGGPGALYDACAYGTDCADCGPRPPRSCDCGSRVCGDDGCGGSCGTCGTFETCNGAGRCEACVPDCTGRECGGDGCGGVCGSTCSGSDTCVDGRCEPDPDGVRMGAPCGE